MFAKQITEAQARTRAKELSLPGGVLSYTQIDTWMKCPRSYYFKYVKKIPMKGFVPALVFGSILHTGLEFALIQKSRSQPWDLSSTSRVMYTALQARLDKEYDEASGMTRNAINNTFHMIEQHIQRFFDHHIQYLTPTQIESTVYCLINEIPCIAKIDLIDNNNYIIDFKLTKNTKKKSDAEKSLQLALYSLSTGIRKTGFISFNSPLYRPTSWTPEIEEVYTNKKTEDLYWAKTLVGEISNAIIAGVFPPCDPTNWKCNPAYCEYWDVCRGAIKTSKKKSLSWLKPQKRTR